MSGSKETRFVVLGFPRSGTTLLRRLLDAHDQVSAPPETGLLTAAARFFSEQDAVEGPPIGVLTGLNFAGISDKVIYAEMRSMIFGIHNRMASGASVWVEKTASDIFHLETLEPLLSGHVKFITLVRNPLDVVASNLDLAGAMGAQLHDLWRMTRGINNPVEGIARAVKDKDAALASFLQRQGTDNHLLLYEDLLEDPEATLGGLLAFMGLKGEPKALIEKAFAQDARIGLGDFRIDGTIGLRPLVKNGWRKRLPPTAPSRIVPILTPVLERHGYDIPKTPPLPSRENAVRQFTFAAQLKRRSTQKAE
ncbi:hypothetical protein IWQ49_006686 [Labrenzia sp. EL_126]|nr:hypothetical protein [Labrenzia sp. EL_126]